MPGITQLVSAISDDLVARISAAGLPPLNDGRIVIGRIKANENAFAPRVVFIPISWRYAGKSPATNGQPQSPLTPFVSGAGVRSVQMRAYGGGYTTGATATFGAPDVAGGTQATGTPQVTANGAIRGVTITNPGSGYLAPPSVLFSDLSGTGAIAVSVLRQTPQALAVMSQPPILTEWHKFEVNVWGCTSASGVLTPDVDTDYDATQQLVHQVIASTHAVAAGVHLESGGRWADAEPSATLIDAVGHYAIFEMEVAEPVLREPMVPTAGGSVQFVPPDTQNNPTLSLQPFDGSPPEQGVP